jgi:hypothetical protein
MKITERDMEHPQFWALNRRARGFVEVAIEDRFSETMSDREAKAVDDAVLALTKVLLIQHKRTAAEIRP